MNGQIYQHYAKDEKTFIDQIYGIIQQVENRYTPYLTGFLTPRQALIVTQILASYDELSVELSHLSDKDERCRALIIPSYYESTTEDFDIALLNIQFPAKFANITHGKILGTLLSTGIERERIGDIITDGDRWQVVVDRTMAQFLILNVKKIGNVGVHLEPMALSEILDSHEEWETETIIVSSMRLDALLSKVYHISRQRAKNAIASGEVKLNFMTMERGDIEVYPQDIVSLRKFGRFWIETVEGQTKKDNLRVIVRILQV